MIPNSLQIQKACLVPEIEGFFLFLFFEELFGVVTDLSCLFLLNRWLCKNHWRRISGSSFKTLYGPT